MKENIFKKKFVIGGVSSRDLMLFSKQLASAIKAGYNIAAALDVAHSQSTGRLEQVLTDIIKMVKSGAYMHEALLKYPQYFPPIFMNLVKTGELSGSLAETMQRLALVLQKEIEFRQKVRSAMTYPTFVFVAVFGLGITVSVFVLPKLLPLFRSLNIDLPLSTKILLWIADKFDLYGTFIFYGMIALLIASFWLFRQKWAQPFTHWLSLHVPIMGRLQREILMGRFARTLGTLLRSGIPIDQAVQISSTILTNYYYQQILISALPLIRKGTNLTEVLGRHVHYFDPLFTKMLALGETTGGLIESCDYAAEYYESDVDDKTKNLEVSLEPILLIIVGLIVAFVAMAILGPIYKITGSIR